MLKIKKFIFNPFQCNTYIVSDSTQGCIIDASNYTESENIHLMKYIESEKISINTVLLTHAHIDHILGLDFISKNITQNIYVDHNDLSFLETATYYSNFFQLNFSPINEKIIINTLESAELQFLNDQLTIIKTPGHSRGSSCFFFQNSNIVFTGDTLFRDSIGRTDLEGGDYEQILSSIKSKILKLPETCTLYSGHGSESTILYEKNNNPFLQL